MDIKEILKDMTVYMLEEGLESIEARVHGSEKYDVDMTVAIKIIVKGDDKDADNNGKDHNRSD